MKPIILSTTIFFCLLCSGFTSDFYLKFTSIVENPIKINCKTELKALSYTSDMLETFREHNVYYKIEYASFGSLYIYKYVITPDNETAEMDLTYNKYRLRTVDKNGKTIDDIELIDADCNDVQNGADNTIQNESEQSVTFLNNEKFEISVIVKSQNIKTKKISVLQNIKTSYLILNNGKLLEQKQ